MTLSTIAYDVQTVSTTGCLILRSSLLVIATSTDEEKRFGS